MSGWRGVASGRASEGKLWVLGGGEVLSGKGQQVRGVVGLGVGVAHTADVDTWHRAVTQAVRVCQSQRPVA